MADKKETKKEVIKKTTDTTDKKKKPVSNKTKSDKVVNKLSKKLKTGTLAEVIAGKFKGEKGKVISVNIKKQRVYLEKVNILIDYPNKLSLEAGAEPKEKNMGVHISNVKVVSK